MILIIFMLILLIILSMKITGMNEDKKKFNNLIEWLPNYTPIFSEDENFTKKILFYNETKKKGDELLIAP